MVFRAVVVVVLEAVFVVFWGLVDIVRFVASTEQFGDLKSCSVTFSVAFLLCFFKLTLYLKIERYVGELVSTALNTGIY